MKTLKIIFAILIVSCSYSCVNQRPISTQQRHISFQVFYDQLSPYGQWADNPNYGYVWFPDAGRNFSPYSTNGYWVMTNYGWTWVSDYRWGWAPFHYGRWDYDNYYGWFWVPDNEWGPSWVTWRRANGYYGWSPMRPGMSISMSYGDRYSDLDHWNFVRENDLGRRDIDRYYINRGNNNRIFRNSTVINNTYIDNSRNVTYISGPQRNDVQRVTGRSINNVTIKDNRRPGEKIDNNRLNIYRPQIGRTNKESQIAAPSRTIHMKDVRPLEERNAAPQRNNVQRRQNNRREIHQTQPPRSQELNGKQNQQIQGRRSVENREQQKRQPNTTSPPEPKKRRR